MTYTAKDLTSIYKIVRQAEFSMHALSIKFENKIMQNMTKEEYRQVMTAAQENAYDMAAAGCTDSRIDFNKKDIPYHALLDYLSYQDRAIGIMLRVVPCEIALPILMAPGVEINEQFIKMCDDLGLTQFAKIFKLALPTQKKGCDNTPTRPTLAAPAPAAEGRKPSAK